MTIQDFSKATDLNAAFSHKEGCVIPNLENALKDAREGLIAEINIGKNTIGRLGSCGGGPTYNVTLPGLKERVIELIEKEINRTQKEIKRLKKEFAQL